MENKLSKFLTDEGYSNLKEVNGLGVCGVHQFIFTCGLVIGLNEVGYSGRYCYHTKSEAVNALNSWDGMGDPPGDWIKYKGRGGERSNEKLSYGEQ